MLELQIIRQNNIFLKSFVNVSEVVQNVPCSFVKKGFIRQSSDKLFKNHHKKKNHLTFTKVASYCFFQNSKIAKKCLNIGHCKEQKRKKNHLAKKKKNIKLYRSDLYLTKKIKLLTFKITGQDRQQLEKHSLQCII